MWFSICRRYAPAAVAPEHALAERGAARRRGGFNRFVFWSRLLDWRNQTLTPNPDAIYLMPFIDTTDEPIVLEIPAAEGGSITGSVDDAWQTAVEDVGLAGVDQGKGGRYLILPPGYEDEVPDGYIAMPAATRRTYALLRSNLSSGSPEDVAAALAYGKRVKLYPLSQADAPPPTTFVDAADVVFDATISYDVRFFEALDRCVQAEPWLARDKAMIDTLKTIGIEKGKPFAPRPQAGGRQGLPAHRARERAGQPVLVGNDL